MISTEYKVHAVNEVNRILKLNVNKIMPQLQKFVGEKIYLVSGDKSSKFNIELDNVEPKQFDGYAQLHRLAIEKSYSNIYLRVSLCFKRDANGCFYQEDSIWLGSLDDQKTHLKEVRTEPFEPKVFDAVEVKRLLERKEALEKELSDVRGEVRYFI